MIDTHVHLDALADARSAWKEARAVGVEGAIAVGVSPETWSRTIEVARSIDGAEIALGIHPQVVPSLDDAAIDAALDALPALLASSGAVALGEIGLDEPSGGLDRQKRVFSRQLAIAKELALPVSLHVYRAHGVALEVLRAFGPLPAGGAAHGYSGSAELVREYVKANLSISFAGSITRSNARRPIAAARAVPRDRLLVETDAPYQPAGADRRDHGEGTPADLPKIVAAIAHARGESVERIADATTENARRTFYGKKRSG